MNIEAGHNIGWQLGPFTDKQWAYILGAFHYAVIFFEPISAFLFVKFTPRHFMGRIMFSWGVVCMCSAAVTNFGSLFACRFLLGAAEAGFMPCILQHLLNWYPSELLTFRIAVVVALARFSGMFSGLLAFAISHLDGKGGLAGWQWLFILEGIPAALCGSYTFVALPNYPEDCKLLTAAERDAVVANRPKTQGSKDDRKWDLQQIKQVLTDFKTLLFMVIFFCHSVGASGVATVLPTVILDLGMTGSTKSQLLTMPHYAGGGITLLVLAFLIQKKKFNIWRTALALETCTGCCLLALIFVTTPIAKYTMILLVNTFSAGVGPILFAERVHTTKGATHASLAISLTGAMPPFHGILGPIIWLRRYAPSYRKSYAISLAILAVAAVFMLAMMLALRKDKSEAQRAAPQAHVEGSCSSEVELRNLPTIQESTEQAH